MLHLIDSVMAFLGQDTWNLFRPGERIDPPNTAIINLWLVTIQTLFLGVQLEIYRERFFGIVFDFVSFGLGWIIEFLRFLLSIGGNSRRALPFNGRIQPTCH
jgi:hypothetical protein